MAADGRGGTTRLLQTATVVLASLGIAGLGVVVVAGTRNPAGTVLGAVAVLAGLYFAASRLGVAAWLRERR